VKDISARGFLDTYFSKLRTEDVLVAEGDGRRLTVL
jgi:hypothetical protein